MLRKLFIFLKKPWKWFRKTRRRNKVLTSIVLVFVILFVGGKIASSAAPSQYNTDVAKKATIVQMVSETGNVNTAGRVDVYSQANGVLEKIYVEDGEAVEVNQDLFHVRSTATVQEKAAAYANYQTALSNNKTAEQGKLTADSQMWAAQQALLDAKNARDYKNNHSINPATGKDYTELEKESIDTAAVQAEKNFRALEKRVLESGTAIDAANAQVASALLAYQATNDITVKAPAAGVVANLSASVGDKVTVDTGMASAMLTQSTQSPVLTIANFTDYSIRIQLNEVDIPKVSVGQKAEVTLDAFSGKKFRGRVEHVDSVGTNTQGVITYVVLVTLLNPDERIKPGMTANVDIEVDKAENVLSVPNSAVKPYKGGRAVRVENQKTKEIEYIPVEVGIKGDERTQIMKGIREGQEIIISLPNDQIKRGSLF